MATPPFLINEAIPGDNDDVSAHPSGARAFRDIVESALAVEHDMKTAGSTARHKFGVGNDAARNAITDWVVGSVWFNTGTTPATLQRVVSVGPVVWENVKGDLTGVALLASANTFTEVLKVTRTTGTETITAESTENTSGSAAFFRSVKTRTGVANDFLGGLSVRGKNASGTEKVWFQYFGQIVTATAAAEDGRCYIRVLRGGADTDWYFDRGCLRYSTQPQPANAGEIDAVNYYKGGVRADGFEGQLFHAAQTATSGTAGGGQTTGSYATRTLNTVLTNEITGVTLSSNQITDVPAGTYWIEVEAAFHSCDQCKIKLRNITDSTDVVLGLTADASSSAGDVATLAGRFTLAATKTLAIQARVTTSNTTTGWGNAASFGDTEVYMTVKLWKIG